MRLLLCRTCASAPYHQKQHPEDRAMGFQWRRVEIPHAKKPAVHHITINGKDQPEMASLLCDGCSKPINDGEPAIAISQWRGGHLGPWEKEFGL